jgi:uncharacterized membrane protein YfcA
MHEIILFLVGIIVGGMNAIAGGGMLIGFPVLLASGVPALIASATTSVIVLPGNVMAILGYRKFLDKIPRSYLLLAVPTIVGSALGTVLLRHTSFSRFEMLVPWLLLMAVALFMFQPLLYKQAHRHIHGPKQYREKWQPVVLLMLAFFPISIYGGFFGTGVGFLMLAFLGFTKIHEIHRMNALKNFLVLCMASTTLLCLFGSHLIDWHSGIGMAAGNAIGGFYGARVSQRFSSHAIRVLVIAVGFAAAAYLAFRTY